MKQKKESLYKDSSISVTLTDANVLDCFICCGPLRDPVFHCKNGHTTCFSCCLKLNQKCPICSVRTTHCKTVEKILQSLKVSCVNSKYGCKDMESYSKINEHQKSCIYEPCFCPKCNVVGSSEMLSLHFSIKHMDSAIHFVYDCSKLSISLNVSDKVVIFQEQRDRTLFVLNNSNVENVGNAVNITCIGPSSLGLMYNYEVRARSRGGGCVELRSCAQSTPTGTVDDILSSGFLMIPSCFFDVSGQIELEICIWPGLC